MTGRQLSPEDPAVYLQLVSGWEGLWPQGKMVKPNNFPESVFAGWTCVLNVL